MIDEGNAQLSAVGFFNPMIGVGDAVSASGGGSSMSGCFDISGDKVVRCALVFGRQWLKCPDKALPALASGKRPAGVIYAEVSHASTDLELDVKHAESGELPGNTLSRSCRALYYAAKSGTGVSATWYWVDVRYQPALFAMN